ncbi:MAG: S8 family serine peptidase [Planctomycetota bacterium]
MHRPSASITAFLSAAAATAAAAPPSDQHAQPTTLIPAQVPFAFVPVKVRATFGTLDVSIAEPNARLSIATPTKPASDKPWDATRSYTITDRVALQATDTALAQLEARGYALERAAMPGFAYVTAGTVTDAIALADILAEEPGVSRAAVEVSRPYASRAVPNDPDIPLAWHLENDQIPTNDINAVGAWSRGYTGQGVTIGVVDEGVASFHEDLFANRNSNLFQNGTVSFHGTAVAGIAVAAGNNDLGAAGVAYNATFGSQTYAQFAPTEQINADALAFKNDQIDIKNNSWGPLDNGFLHPLDPIELAAIEDGATNGRGGLGTVFVWAAGNGGNNDDRPDYDGFAASRHTIAIGSVGHLGRRATYNERGSAMFAVAFSNGNTGPDNVQRQIFTTRHPTTSSGDAYTGFGGTSAAAPSATGAVALALEANPNLTQRDVQHLIADTVRIVDDENADWSTNASGRLFNENYGFGVIDAEAMVEAAETWNHVGPAFSYDAGTKTANADLIDNDHDNPAELTFKVAPQIKTEHVEIRVRMTGTYLGDARIELVSPRGTVARLADTRFNGFDTMDHLYTSVRHWDERAAGTWTLRVSDGAPGDTNTLIDASLTVHGTCLADQDRSGTIDIDDYFTWLTGFNTLQPDADVNGDRAINSSDFFAWLTAVTVGC